MRKFLKETTPIITAIASIVTVIGTCFSIYLAILSIKNYDTSTRLAKEQLTAKIESQANHFAIWIIDKPENVKNENPKLSYFKVKNTSNFPVYDVLVLSVHSDRNVTLSNIEGLYNASTANDGLTHNTDDLMEQNDDESTHYAFQSTVAPGETYGYVNGRSKGWAKNDEIVYFFRDSNGRIWYRSNKGQLERIKAEKADNLLKNIGVAPKDIFSPFSKFNE